MINYSVLAGDSQVGRMFQPYIWGPSGIRTLLRVVDDEPYGTGLNSLLIRFYVEGQFPISAPAALKVRRYSTSTKNITVAIPVTPAQFHEVGEAQRREFILKSTWDAFNAVKRRLQKKHLNIDFAQARRDLEWIGQTYLNAAPN